ncbi:MAG: hypothetical protein COB01_11910, partial [Lutibacter sp.]
MKLVILVFLPLLVLASGCGTSSSDEEIVDNNSNDHTDSLEIVDETSTYDIYLTMVEKHLIPDGCDYEGKVIDANSWDDVNG